MANKKIRIGIIGCGAIGSQLAGAIKNNFSEQAELFAICDIDRDKAENLKADFSLGPEVLLIDELIERSELIIEAASAKISYEVAQKALAAGKNVIIMSVGGILDKYDELRALAQDAGGHIYLPSGAVAGLDAVKAASMVRVNKVTLTTRKPPQGLAGAPYLAEKNIDLSAIKEETVIFEGEASEAIKGFPQNVNVCATLSLAGIGPKKTRVKIITSPEYKTNIHEIEAEGDFGRLFARTENLPFPQNPRTSFLASLSAIATLRNILDVVKIGT